MSELIAYLEALSELQDGTATSSMSPTYFEVDGESFKAALQELREYHALRERIETSAKSMEHEVTGRFFAAHMRQLVTPPEPKRPDNDDLCGLCLQKFGHHTVSGSSGGATKYLCHPSRSETFVRRPV